MKASPQTNNAREFINGLKAISKHPDGNRRLRFIATMMARMKSRTGPTKKMTEDEIWKRYEEFCEKETA